MRKCVMYVSRTAVGGRQQSACHGAESGQIGGRGRVWGGGGTPEPSSSLLLKQLSMMRRFSSSKRSARLMPGLADMVASP